MDKLLPAKDTLTQTGLLRLLAVLSLVLAPHLPRLPLWASGLVAGLIAWRAAAALKGWPLLPSTLRVGLTLAAFVGVYESFGRVSGQTAGVALVTVMGALKLTELKARRDMMVMGFLMYFILVTHFLFSQEPWTAVYLLVCAACVTAMLVDANHPGGALPLAVALRFGARFVVQALPLMAIIFLLFPRIPGPIWGLPSDAGAARSGLSDTMSPGEISQLVQSDEVAFRVRFFGAVPTPAERYWRGPVFARFDGRRWDAGQRPPESANPQAELEGPAYDYEVVLEANRTPWLLALDLPERNSLPEDSYLTPDYQLVLSHGELRERRLYRLRSHSHYRLQAELPPRLRDQLLRLPRGFNPKTVALGRSWREQGLSEPDIVDAALRMFRNEAFFYTLQPPKLGRDAADEFLFDTRRGFCEHYAGSFTLLMRAAGLPARVVTGYQGGELNGVGDYYIVRQSDAHAWSEVWLAGRGWVRIDPTAAVAPSRIERGLGAALTGSDFLPAFLDPSRRHGLRFDLKARWDWVNAQWNHWVLGYGPDLQAQFLRRFGIDDWTDMILALTVLLSAVLGLTGLLLLRRSMPTVSDDPALRLWQRAQAKFQRAGLRPRVEEGPADFARRAARQRPEHAEAISAIAADYLALRYLGEPDSAKLRAFAKRVAEWRPGSQLRRP